MQQVDTNDTSETPTETAIIGLQSKELVDWVDKVVKPMLKKGPIDKVLGFVQANILNWGSRYSLWPIPLGIKCCALEMAASFNSTRMISGSRVRHSTVMRTPMQGQKAHFAKWSRAGWYR